MTGTNPRYWAVVPAAGSGKRFSDVIPKQFFTLLGETIAQHTLSRLLSIPQIEKIIVSCDTKMSEWQQVPAVDDGRLVLISGGVERANSVLLGLEALNGEANDNDWVLVHDIARPCITSGDVERLMSELEREPNGGILAAPVSDTLKVVTPEGTVERTENREFFRAAQTPQMFRYGLLKKAIKEMLASGQLPTDEAAAMEFAGRQVRIVEGRWDNLKVTRREDLVIAEAVIKYQREELLETEREE